MPPSPWSCTSLGQDTAKGGLMRFVSGVWWKKGGERRHEQEWGDFLHRGGMSLGAEQLPEVAQHLCHRRATSGPVWVVSPGDAPSILTYLSLRGSRNGIELPRNPLHGCAGASLSGTARAGSGRLQFTPLSTCSVGSTCSLAPAS